MRCSLCCRQLNAHNNNGSAEAEPSVAPCDMNSLIRAVSCAATSNNSRATHNNHGLAEAKPSLACYDNNYLVEVTPSAAISEDNGLAVLDDAGPSKAVPPTALQDYNNPSKVAPPIISHNNYGLVEAALLALFYNDDGLVAYNDNDLAEVEPTVPCNGNGSMEVALPALTPRDKNKSLAEAVPPAALHGNNNNKLANAALDGGSILSTPESNNDDGS